MLHFVKMQDVVENCKHRGTCIKKIAKQKHNKRHLHTWNMNKIIKPTRKLGKGEEMQEWGKKM
jgi:hypothetical protein